MNQEMNDSTVVNVSVSLGIKNCQLLSEEISALLGVVASESHNKGEVNRLRDGRIFSRPNSTWAISSVDHIKSNVLDDHLKFFADLVSKKPDEFAEINEKSEYVGLWISLHLPWNNCGIEIDARCLRQCLSVVDGLNLNVLSHGGE